MTLLLFVCPLFSLHRTKEVRIDFSFSILLEGMCHFLSPHFVRFYTTDLSTTYFKFGHGFDLFLPQKIDSKNILILLAEKIDKRAQNLGKNGQVRERASIHTTRRGEGSVWQRKADLICTVYREIIRKPHKMGHSLYETYTMRVKRDVFVAWQCSLISLGI